MLILLHAPMYPQDLIGDVPAQAGWMVWQQDWQEIYAFATGNRARAHDAPLPKLELISPANTARASHRVALQADTTPPRELLNATLGSRLRREGVRAIYLTTDQSPSPSPYALIALSEQRATPARVYPDLESLRLDFFTLKADWAILELKRWDYRALELLLAEGVEVWVVAIPSPAGLSLGSARLSAVVRYAAREPQGLLTSPSTRWNGVLHEIDLAPTLYRALTRQDTRTFEGAPALETRQSDWHRFWNGWLARIALQETTSPMGFDWKGNALQRNAEWAQARREVLPTLRSSLLALFLTWLGTGVALWRAHRLRGLGKSVFIAGLSVFSLTPAVAVLYSYYPYELWTGEVSRDIASSAAWLTLGWTVYSLMAAGVARWARISLLSASMVVSMTVVGADLLIAGGYGINRALLSEGIAGARPFGANEWYWAHALSAGVLVPASWLESQGRLTLGARGQMALGMAYGLMVCLFGLPMMGSALDSLLPLSVAWGLRIGLLTGLIRIDTDWRRIRWICAGLLGVGIALTGLAVGLDALQPWQRQAGWARDWQTALGWKFVPLQVVLTASVSVAIIFVLKKPLRGLWQRAYALRHALGVCSLTAVLCLGLGKLIAASVILIMCLMFALEYLVGGKDWGYAYRENGVAH
ncbi:MAG: hypothetical protein ACK4ME_08050 [Fimbriimonadales bacterium]